MSLRVSTYKIEDLVNPSNIKIWVSANDVNASIGANVNTVTCKYTGTVFTKETANNFIIPAIPYNNNEIFIGIYNVYTTATNVLLYGGSNVVSLGQGAFLYADNITASSKINFSAVYGSKTVQVGVFTSTEMYAMRNFNKVASLANPTTGIGSPNARLFNNVIAPSTTVDYYFFARIQEVPTADKMKKLIRTIGFEHGILI
jgi:hypothetical protein